MSSGTRKRKAREDQTITDLPDFEAVEEASHRDVASKRTSTRVRTPSSRKEAMDSAQNEQLLAKIKKLEADNARLKKKATASAAPVQPEVDDDDDPDKLPVESEEEQEYIVEGRKMATTFRSRGIYDADGKDSTSRKLRRMDDPAGRSSLTHSGPRPPSTPTPISSRAPSRPLSATPPPPPASMIDPRLRDDDDASESRHDNEAGATTTPPSTPHTRSTTPPLPRSRTAPPTRVRSDSPDEGSHHYRPRQHDSDRHRRDRSGSGNERSVSPPPRQASRYQSTEPTASEVQSTRYGATSRSSSSASTAPRSRSSAPTVPSRHLRSRSSPRPSESPEPEQPSVPVATKPPPFRGGVAPTGDAKASDYEPHATKLILTACRHFEALVLTEDPFPDDTTQEAWVKRVWQDACTALKLSYTLPERIKKLIVSRTSHARGALKDCIRPMVAAKYGFSSLTDEATRVANRALYEHLLDLNNPEGPEPKFHYQDVNTLAGYARNEIVSHAIREQWFRNTDGIGLQLPAQFCPIREETLAIIFTAIEFCLDQWADGTLKSEGGRFSEKEYKPKYKAHLARIELWSKLIPTVTEAIRKQMHDDARLASGATPVLGAPPSLSATSRSRLQAELDEFAKTMR